MFESILKIRIKINGFISYLKYENSKGRKILGHSSILVNNIFIF